jgi:hypothetical protein
MVRVYRLHECCKAAPPFERPSLELADLLRGAARYPLTPEQHRAAHRLMRCRTAALGAHVTHCLRCGHDELAYNSCYDRHCPKCQGHVQTRWIAQREARVLNTHYFHVVFTLPEALRPVALANPKPVYALLLRAAAKPSSRGCLRRCMLGGIVECGVSPLFDTEPSFFGVDFRSASQHEGFLPCSLGSGGALSRDPSQGVNRSRRVHVSDGRQDGSPPAG